jgi:mycofactocin precursor
MSEHDVQTVEGQQDQLDQQEQQDQQEPELLAEDLIEEVSIDGMCGVY